MLRIQSGLTILDIEKAHLAHVQSSSLLVNVFQSF